MYTLTKGQLKCLLMGYFIQNETGSYFKGIDLASALGVSRASAQKTLTLLADKGYILHQRQQHYQLSEKGRVGIEPLLPFYEKINKFFQCHIGLDEFESREAALALLLSLQEKSLRQICSRI